MALGRRFGNSLGGLHRAGTAGTQPPPTEVVDVGTPRVEYRYPTLIPELREVPALSSTALVATLTGPPHGQEFVIERLVIANMPAVVFVGIYVGEISHRNARDAVLGPTDASLVSDDPNGIRVPSAAPLHIVWQGPTSVGNYGANLQIRVEEV